MTVAEAIKIREKEEALCKRCSRFVCRKCTECNHGSEFVEEISVLKKIKDRAIENYC